MATKSTSCNKLKWLLWKNWMIRWNHKCILFWELMIPVLVSLLMMCLRATVEPELVPIIKYSPLDLSLNSYNSFAQNFDPKKVPQLKLLYSPKNILLDNIAKDAAESLHLTGYQGYANTLDLENALMAGNYLAGVQFDDSLVNIKEYPKNFKYSLRFPSVLRTEDPEKMITWQTTKLYSILEENILETDDVPTYIREGFIPIQNAISMAYLKFASENKTKLPSVQLQCYPYPAHLEDPLSIISAFISPFLHLGFIFLGMQAIKHIVNEKEKQLKEVMKMMGVANWLHWTAWFFMSFIIYGISCFLIIIALLHEMNNVALIKYTSGTVMLFFLLIYGIVIIWFSFMIATFFSKASTAAAAGGLFFFITIIPYFSSNYNRVSLGSKLLFSLLPGSALCYGFKVISYFEDTGEGLQWKNVFTPISVDDNLTLGYVILMMLASCALYMAACLYIEEIFPGDFGVRKKWNFPFTQKFWRGDSKYTSVDGMPNGGNERLNSEAFEAEPSGKYAGVQVKNLTKEFGDKMAVNGVVMNMYENEITVLLGHNGAGKTTTISMLTGMIAPTAGTAVINGSDIRSNIDGARASLGICPQHNVLFDELSVGNHILFFCRLRGLKGDAAKREMRKYLKWINLEKDSDTPSAHLSGGMKRKLSMCCALCGDTKVVLLDEPSSAMDPSARRQLWDLLQAEKNGRTVLLTTHYMDEADVLGDRIAIMSNGELKCLGTPFFLKKKFGSGYRLICAKRENCNSDEVTALLQQYIPDVHPESDIGAELTYNLADSYSSKFEEMLSTLEDRADKLKLEGYGIGISSLEEVFLKMGAEKIAIEQDRTENQQTVWKKIRHLKGTDLFLNQCHAMFLKKLIHTYRNKICITLLITILVAFLALPLMGTNEFNKLPSMTMSLTQYPSVVTVLETASNIEPDSLEAKIADQYNSVARSYGSIQSTGAESFTDYILNLGKTIQARINSRYLVAATVEKGTITAWLNSKPLHMAPLALNLVHNAMARALIAPSAQITITNDPLPYTAETISQQTAKSGGLNDVTVNVMFGMCIFSAFYTMFLVKERESRSKLLQFVSSVKVWIFWLTHLLWDLLLYMVMVFMAIIVFACFQAEGLSTFSELGRFCLILIIFGLSMLPFTYLISFLFNGPATSFSLTLMINFFFAYILFAMFTIVKHIYPKTATISTYFLRLYPHFSLALSLSKVGINDGTRKTCSSKYIAQLSDDLRCKLVPMCCKTIPYFAYNEPGILLEILYMCVTAVVYFIILLVYDNGMANKPIYKMSKLIRKYPPKQKDVDEDVDHEKQRILAMSKKELSEQTLVLDHISKCYGKLLALNQLSLCVQKKECFGLLGVNGAGKTTAFKIMTGETLPSYGAAYTRGQSVLSNMHSIYKWIGYCPQFDALLEDFTGRETLKIIYLLRGYNKRHINQLSEDLANSFGFMKHLDKRIENFSGGSKRKLSTAIATIGNPSIIYLDEPTTGIDPVSKRQLWNILCGIRDSGKSIVLTTHSMEECEALCTRLAIMVNGEFKCIGSTQHLKNKFSMGFILKIKTKSDIEVLKAVENTTDDQINKQRQSSISYIKEFVEREFSKAVLQEEFQGILTFYIPLLGVKWSEIFGLMERNRDELNILDYTISQTTLEEIFLEFARYQK